MRIDKFTQKGQEALLEAQNLAQKYNHLFSNELAWIPMHSDSGLM